MKLHNPLTDEQVVKYLRRKNALMQFTVFAEVRHLLS